MPIREEDGTFPGRGAQRFRERGAKWLEARTKYAKCHAMAAMDLNRDGLKQLARAAPFLQASFCQLLLLQSRVAIRIISDRVCRRMPLIVFWKTRTMWCPPIWLLGPEPTVEQRPISSNSERRMPFWPPII